MTAINPNKFLWFNPNIHRSQWDIESESELSSNHSDSSHSTSTDDMSSHDNNSQEATNREAIKREPKQEHNPAVVLAADNSAANTKTENNEDRKPTVKAEREESSSGTVRKNTARKQGPRLLSVRDRYGIPLTIGQPQATVAPTTKKVTARKTTRSAPVPRRIVERRTPVEVEERSGEPPIKRTARKTFRPNWHLPPDPPSLYNYVEIDDEDYIFGDITSSSSSGEEWTP